MSKKTVIIYLLGKPGVGKYTIAKEFAKSFDFTICDNQLINSPIFHLFPDIGNVKIPDFAWDSIGRIRNEVLKFLAKMPNNNFVLTNCLFETPGDHEIYKLVENMARSRNSAFVPVKLLIDKKEHLTRLTREERRKRLKTTDPINAENNDSLISIDHPNYLELKISLLSPEEACKKIINHLNDLGISYNN